MSAKENADFLMDAAMRHGISQPKELANFMGQMHVQSGSFSRLGENLPDTATDDESSYRARGFVQLTGRDNYEKVGEALGVNLVDTPKLAEERELATKIALYYWVTCVVASRHQESIAGACSDLNGDQDDVVEREAAVNAWEHAIHQGYTPGSDQALPFASRSGRVSHEATLHVQTLLNTRGCKDSSGHALAEDGVAGAKTHLAILEFQRDHHLRADGIVGPATLKELQKTPETAPPTTAVPVAPLLDSEQHPLHPLYKQTLICVEELDAQQGRAPGPHTIALAGSLTVAAATASMTGVDRVILSDDVLSAYAVQGPDNSPFKTYAQVDLAQAVTIPIEKSSADANHINSQPTATQQLSHTATPGHSHGL